MRVLVTGAAGLIGRALCEHLLARGDTVLAVSRGAPPEGTTHVPLDLSRPWSDADLPPAADAVAHLAQEPNYRGFPDAAPAMFEVNLASTARLLDWSRRHGVRHFALASSGGLYGASDQAIDEAHAIHTSGPLAYYLSTKRAAELLAEPYASAFGVSVARIFFAHGKGQKPGFLIPSLARSIRESRPIKLAGEDGIQLNPIASDDVARAFAALLDRSGHTLVNVAGAQVLTLRRISEIIGERVGKAPLFEIDRAARPGHVVADIARMRALLGPPVRAFEEALDV